MFVRAPNHKVWTSCKRHAVGDSLAWSCLMHVHIGCPGCSSNSMPLHPAAAIGSYHAPATDALSPVHSKHFQITPAKKNAYTVIQPQCGYRTQTGNQARPLDPPVTIQVSLLFKYASGPYFDNHHVQLPGVDMTGRHSSAQRLRIH